MHERRQSVAFHLATAIRSHQGRRGYRPKMPCFHCLVPVTLAAILLQSAVGQTTASPSFSRDVAPILQQNCVSCHKPQQKLSALDLSSRAAALKGGEKSGAPIVPGDANASPLYRRIIGKDQPAMPLGAKLPDAQIAIIKSWIDAGAAWDEQAVATSSNAAQQRNWWAFRKPVRHPIPEVASRRWASHPIDGFIKKTLEAKGLEPAPQADRRTLLRRAYLDLIGLLPPADEVEAFVKDTAADAWERRVDALLASSHYGERWARHWLDVARYAD